VHDNVFVLIAHRDVQEHPVPLANSFPPYTFITRPQPTSHPLRARQEWQVQEDVALRCGTSIARLEKHEGHAFRRGGQPVCASLVQFLFLTCPCTTASCAF